MTISQREELDRELRDWIKDDDWIDLERRGELELRIMYIDVSFLNKPYKIHLNL